MTDLLISIHLHYLNDLTMSKITPTLWLGSYVNSIDPVLLSKNKIGLIISVATECKFAKRSHSPPLCVMQFDINSKCSDHFTPETLKTVYEAITYAEENSINVLVHCVNGLHRSPVFVIYYLMKKHNMTLEDAYTHVQSRRNVVCPPQSFLKKLAEATTDTNITMPPTLLTPVAALNP